MKRFTSGYWSIILVSASVVLACGDGDPAGGIDSSSGGSAMLTSGGSSASAGGSASGGNMTSVTGGQGNTSGGSSGSGGTPDPDGGGGQQIAGGSGGGPSSGGSTSTGGATDNGILVPVAADPDDRHFLLRDEGKSELHYLDLGAPEKSWHVGIPVGRELQLVGNNRILIGTENGYEERSAVDGAILATLDTFAGTVAARRLRNGNTLLVGADWQGATGVVLLEVDATGVEMNRVVYPDYNYARLVRPTLSGNYLVTSDLTIFEGDATGNVIWKVTVQDSTEPHAWKALRLASGETVVATGYEASLQFFSSSQQFLRRIRATSETTPNFYCDFQILPSGNYLVTNWQGHGTDQGGLGHQLVELDPQGTQVWSYKQDATVFSSIQAAILLDGLNLGKLHVEDTTGELVPVD